MSGINQKAYLKKYLSIGSDPSKKKKKKKDKRTVGRVKIIDDDIDIVATFNAAVEEDLYGTAEDAPQIVGILDDRPLEKRADDYRLSDLWKPVGAESSSFAQPVNSAEDRSTSKSPSISKSRDNGYGDEESSENPPRRRSHDNSPPRKKRDEGYPEVRVKIEDESPPRRRREEDSSPPRKRQDDSLPKRRQDNSPPRRRKNEDNSPPRKIKIEDSSPPRRRKDEDISPPRKRRNDASPPRKRKDSSPPRRRTTNVDAPAKIKQDNSPPRRRRNEDASPPRRDRNLEAGPSRSNNPSDGPAKKKSRWNRSISPVDGSPKTMEDYLRNESIDTRFTEAHLIDPTNIHSTNIHSTKIHPTNTHSTNNPPKDNASSPGRSGKKSKKTLDGKKAGLQVAKELVQEVQAFKQREDALFKNLAAEVSGVNAETVLRDRSTGKVRDFAHEAEVAKKKQEEEERKKEKYSRWGKGLKQVDEEKEKIAQDLYEMTKPLARYADDEDLEKYLKDQEREGDPMLAYIRKKKRKKAVVEGKPVKQEYQGEFMPNRYGIPPGHRWDGVERSNGYEKRWFETLNKKKAQQDEAYRWNTEDM